MKEEFYAIQKFQFPLSFSLSLSRSRVLYNFCEPQFFLYPSGRFSLLVFQPQHPTPARNDHGPIIPGRVSWNAYASTRWTQSRIYMYRYTQSYSGMIVYVVVARPAEIPLSVLSLASSTSLYIQKNKRPPFKSFSSFSILYISSGHLQRVIQFSILSKIRHLFFSIRLKLKNKKHHILHKNISNYFFQLRNNDFKLEFLKKKKTRIRKKVF